MEEGQSECRLPRFRGLQLLQRPLPTDFGGNGGQVHGQHRGDLPQGAAGGQPPAGLWKRHLRDRPQPPAAGPRQTRGVDPFPDGPLGPGDRPFHRKARRRRLCPAGEPRTGLPPGPRHHEVGPAVWLWAFGSGLCQGSGDRRVLLPERSILDKGADRLPLPEPPAVEALPVHANVRGSDYFHIGREVV